MLNIESQKVKYKGVDMQLVYSILFPIMGVMFLCAAGYIIYTQYLNPKEDRYTSLP